MSYWRTYYHLVWSTKNREPTLTSERTTMLQQSFRVVAKDKGAYTHAIGGMPDHIHIAVSIPPTISVSDYVQLLKGSSSRYLSKQVTEPGMDAFAWQGHYGVLTFGERSLVNVVQYIEHHANDDIWPSFELIPSPQ